MSRQKWAVGLIILFILIVVGFFVTTIMVRERRNSYISPVTPVIEETTPTPNK